MNTISTPSAAAFPTTSTMESIDDVVSTTTLSRHPLARPHVVVVHSDEREVVDVDTLLWNDANDNDDNDDSNVLDQEQQQEGMEVEVNTNVEQEEEEEQSSMCGSIDAMFPSKTGEEVFVVESPRYSTGNNRPQPQPQQRHWSFAQSSAEQVQVQQVPKKNKKKQIAEDRDDTVAVPRPARSQSRSSADNIGRHTHVLLQVEQEELDSVPSKAMQDGSHVDHIPLPSSPAAANDDDDDDDFCSGGENGGATADDVVEIEGCLDDISVEGDPAEEQQGGGEAEGADEGEDGGEVRTRRRGLKKV